MISTSYANFDEFKAASRQIYFPMLRVDKFAFFFILVNLSTKMDASYGRATKSVGKFAFRYARGGQLED